MMPAPCHPHRAVAGFFPLAADIWDSLAALEKLQTISTKFGRQQETREFPVNFMRHYYDVFSLLKRPEVQAFLGTDA